MDADNDVISRQILDRASLAPDIRALSSLSFWPAAWAIACQWIIIAAAAFLFIHCPNWLTYLAGAVIISSRQHALGVLTHEAAHYRLFRNRRFNDIIGDLLLAFPSGISTSVYRGNHFEHHRFVNTPRDPNIQLVEGDEDWLWPKLPWECFKIFALDLVGINYRYMADMLWSWSPLPRLVPRKNIRWKLTAAERLRLALFGVGLITALTLTPGGWKYFVLLWIIPGATMLTLINRVRNLAEHYGVKNEHELNASRHTAPRWWERLLFAPCNINYHLDHHLFPSVPFYNLPKLHSRLMREPEFREHAHLTQTYSGVVQGVLAELLKRGPENDACSTSATVEETVGQI